MRMIQQASASGACGVKLPGGRARQRSAGATTAAVLALNRNFQALQIISVRRALCLMYKVTPR
ncbi:MAG: hypothetical protein R3B90_12885 [Planctomycetaceae bacterium]